MRNRNLKGIASKKIATFILQRYWRLSRSVTLGVQGLVVDPDQRILLVRHTYRSGWHFPGGGVEKKENTLSALKRELKEEAGILLEGPPQLFSLYTNFRYFAGDHIALFVVRSWKQPYSPPPNKEIAEHKFFSRDDLPADVVPAVLDRLDEYFNSRTPKTTW